MLNLYQKRFVRFVTTETPEARLIVAVLFETRGNETVVVGEPRIVKVVPKEPQKLLLGSGQKILCLEAPCIETKTVSCIPSPFYTTIFGYTNSDTSISLLARPPTVL